ncbi:MAG: hypothetical protein FWD84_05970, partial [Oscillospiraceae bacterium]|nr:hypothetical protein [Oscillospiraceae bacterium]
FAGALGWDDIHDIAFEIEGWDSDDLEDATRIFHAIIPLRDLERILLTEKGQIAVLFPDQILLPGFYTIRELGAEHSVNAVDPGDPNDHEHAFEVDVSFAFNGTDAEAIPPDQYGFWLDHGDNVTITITNTYTRLPAVILTKVIEVLDYYGSPIESDFITPEDIFFTIVGPLEAPLDEQIMRNIPFSMFNEMGQFVVTGLRPGTYTIEETALSVPGYTLAVLINGIPQPESPGLFEFVVGIAGTEDIEITFTNRYVHEYVPPARIVLTKLFYGELPSPLPDDIVFIITGPDGYEAEIPLGAFDTDGQYMIDDLLPGEYTIMEEGGSALGYLHWVNHNEGFEITLRPGEAGEVIFENYYTRGNLLSSGTLIIEKDFVDLPEGTVLPDIEFQIIGTDEHGEEIFNETISYADFDGGAYELSVPVGTYVITESGGHIDGLYWIPPPSQTVAITAGATITVTFINRYTDHPPERGSLIIEKTFYGLPEDVPFSDISFLIIGTDENGAEIYRQIVWFRDFTEGSDRYTYELTDLPSGTFVIYESGGFAAGHTLLPPPPQTVTITVGAVITITFENIYESIPPEDIRPGLRLRKIFHGLAPDELPEDFKLIITGQNGFEEQFGLEDILHEGVLLENLEPGEYTITEIDADVPDFTMTVAPALPYTITITEEDADKEVLVIINNIYTPVEPPEIPLPPQPPFHPPQPPLPPPPEEEDSEIEEDGDDSGEVEDAEEEDPEIEEDGEDGGEVEDPPNQTPPPRPPSGGGSPETGDNRQMAPYIALLILGIGSMGGAIVYQVRKKLSYQGKHL